MQRTAMRMAIVAGAGEFVLALLLTVGLAGVAGAAPITFSDPYGGQNPGSAANNGDVIGSLAGFDIESVTFNTISQASASINLRFNYNGDPFLAPYQFNAPSGPWMSVGDLLLSVNGSYKYGVALVDHDGYVAGNLYSISGARTSNDPAYLGNYVGQYVWGFNLPVRMNTGGTQIGAGTASTVNVGYNELDTTLLFTPGGDFWNDTMSGAFAFHFASAICANDVIGGTLPTSVPEPGSLLLLAAGLAGVAAAPWRKRRPS